MSKKDPCVKCKHRFMTATAERAGGNTYLVSSECRACARALRRRVKQLEELIVAFDHCGYHGTNNAGEWGAWRDKIRAKAARIKAGGGERRMG